MKLAAISKKKGLTMKFFSNIYSKVRVMNQLWFFAILLSLVFYFYEYNKSIYYPPHGIHAWRQTDACSMALNYYQKDANFFTPSLHRLRSDEYTSGAGVSEAPLTYYLAAGFYVLFGHNNTTLRLIHLLIFTFGLFCLFYLFRSWFRNFYLSAALAFSVFAGPVMVYYANNYLPNAPALGFALAGWMFLFRYFKENFQRRYFAWAVAMFTLSTLLKITTGMNFAVVLGLFCLDCLGFFQRKEGKILFPEKKKLFLPIFIYCFIVVTWYSYVLYYNHIHRTEYFANATQSIFTLKTGEVLEFWNQLRKNWEYLYWSKEFWIFSGFVFIFNILFIRRSNRLLTTIFVLLFLVSISYLLLWYKQFVNHDYYFIDLYILFVFNLFLFFDSLKRMFPKGFVYPIFVTAFSIFILFQFGYCRHKNSQRYYNYLYDEIVDYIEVKPHLCKLNVQATDKVIVLGDFSNLISLYYLNRFGWCIEKMHKTIGHEIDLYIQKGAKFLIIDKNKVNTFPDEFRLKYMKNCIGKFHSLHFNRIDGRRQTYTELKPEKLVQDFFTDCERLNSQKNCFVGTKNTEFENAAFLENNIVHSGKNAVRLQYEKIYALKTNLKNIKPASRIVVKAWAQINEGQLDIVCSTPGGSSFYSAKAFDKESTSVWRQIETEVVCPNSVQGKEISVYFWLVKGGLAYVDDISIEVFE